MNKTFAALVAAATIAGSLVTAMPAAQAQHRHYHGGGGAGLAAGLIGGAIIGGAIASQNGYYGGPGYYAPAPRYYGGPAYVAEPGYAEDCIWQKQRFWDGYGWRVRSVRVCD